MSNNFWKDTLIAFQNIQEKKIDDDFIFELLQHNEKN